MKKVLAIASAGGHWKQLLLLEDAFKGANVLFLTTKLTKNDTLDIEAVYVQDSNKNRKLALLKTFFQILKVIVTFKPDIILSTGAAPGAIGLVIGKVLGKKVIWIDSIANSEKLSLGAKICKLFGCQVLTQWNELADGKITYQGAVY